MLYLSLGGVFPAPIVQGDSGKARPHPARVLGRKTPAHQAEVFVFVHELAIPAFVYQNAHHLFLSRSQNISSIT